MPFRQSLLQVTADSGLLTSGATEYRCCLYSDATCVPQPIMLA